jgi:redox-sensitive bicupin YhaK (pirin superfamily)
MSHHILHKAGTRGHANHGWLNSYQTFSFANYYNPERVHFGALRVLNDDIVTGGKGFGLHPHENMEIISIPLEGDLEHKDNMGNTKVIRQGDLQVMSTGTGVFHSEYNHNADRDAKFLQIWLFPNQMNVAPRYDQLTLDLAQRKNQLQQVISPNPDAAGTWVYQDTWFNMGIFDQGKEATYHTQREGNGVYFFVISGSFTVDGQRLDARDGLGITEAGTINITAAEDGAEILIMDVPMELKA